MSGSMRSRKSEIAPKCLTPTCLTITHRLAHRRRSHANGNPALKTDFFGQQQLRAQSPYAITFRQSITKPRRKGSLGIRSGPKPSPIQPKPFDLRPYRGQPNYSLISKQQVELENSRRKARTPSPTFFSSLPRPRHSPKSKDGKGKKTEGNRISMENVLQTPGEDEPTDNSAAIYTTALEKSLEQYLSYQPAPALKSLLLVPASPTATRGSQVEPEPSSHGAHTSYEPPSFTHPHRRVYLSSEVSTRNRSLTPTPPCF